MTNFVRALVFVAMCLLTMVSMFTTYVSLRDSILPHPIIPIPLGAMGVWECSVMALFLSVATGLMLIGLKLAIIGEEKRLNPVGFVGLLVVAFISIAFNMDVLYRWADQDFFVRYSSEQVKDRYARYLKQVEGELLDERDDLSRQIAAQRGELKAEIQGLREAPAGYGQRARAEEHRLTVMQETAQVQLARVQEALAASRTAKELLVKTAPEDVAEVHEMQDQLRVAVSEAGAAAGTPLPETVQLQNPLFAVFSRLFDLERAGMKELLILLIAIFLDLGDILGYTLVPNRGRRADAARTRSTRGVVEAQPSFIRGPLSAPDFAEADSAARGSVEKTQSPGEEQQEEAVGESGYPRFHRKSPRRSRW